MKRGEVWWAALPEPLGRRPVVLVSRGEAYEVRQSVAAVEVTTTIRGLASEVLLGPADGLPERCVANADAIHTIDRRRFTERVARLRADRIRALDAALRFALELEA